MMELTWFYGSCNPFDDKLVGTVFIKIWDFLNSQIYKIHCLSDLEEHCKDEKLTQFLVDPQIP